MNAHTSGALRAAKIIMNGRGKINTEYGQKTLEGIADLIERETGLPELLDALKGLFDNCSMIHKHWGDNSNQVEADRAIMMAHNLIADIEGRL